MRSRTVFCCAPIWSVIAAIGVSCVACQPVKEDRTVTWSAQGDQVGFQHGKEGVFVADRDGRGLEQVYQPGPDIVATSTPLWSPTGGRLMFTTARDPNPAATPAMPRMTLGDPSGDAFAQMPVSYTCWLREEGVKGEPEEPQPLFEAACNHVGYVAANLAVRWHPSGDKILFIDRIGAQHHGLFSYDLASGLKEQACPHTADAIVFDFCPDGLSLACVLASSANTSSSDGTWIGRPGAPDWWHVPQSESLAPAVLESVLERLRASRPAWLRDGGRFAFVTVVPQPDSSAPARSRIWLGNPATREVKLLTESDGTIDDLAWSPDGTRLGMIRGSEERSLGVLSLDGEWLSTAKHRTVTRFAGWNGSGSSLAYVSTAAVPFADEESWALLLLPDPQSRDAVFVMSGDGGAAPREVASGLRVTFPRWSPQEDKLSLWFTFSPSHRSWLSRWLGWGLLPGDPAAIVDLAAGRIDWMALGPWEEAQIGHYHLLKGDYAEAWRRYKRAGQGHVEPVPTTSVVDFFGRLQSPRDIGMFEYVCLRKLGRIEEANEHLAAFRRRFPPDASQLPTVGSPGTATQAGAVPLDAQVRELFARDGLTSSLMRDLYMAEVCLSVDAPDEAETAFRRHIEAGEGEMATLSAEIVLAQLFLLERRYDEYLDRAIAVLLPAVAKTWRSGAASPGAWPTLNSQGVLMLAGGLTLLPLGSSSFLAVMDDARVAQLADALEKLRPATSDDAARLAIDTGLLAAYERLNDAEQATAAKARIATNPAAAGYFSGGEISHRIDELRRELLRFSEINFGPTR